MPMLNQVSEQPSVAVALLTGGWSDGYLVGLASGLLDAGVEIECVGGDELSVYPVFTREGVRYVNLRGSTDSNASFSQKALRILRYYVRLMTYSLRTRCRLFHVQWENKFIFLDRTLLLLYYKILGKRLVLTAHNVNGEEREGRDSALNRFSLKVMYTVADHIIVHTARMKTELSQRFRIEPAKVSVIPYGVYGIANGLKLSRNEARQKLSITLDRKVILFFGAIDWYKGLDVLVESFKGLLAEDPSYMLIVAGKPKYGQQYLAEIVDLLRGCRQDSDFLLRPEFIPEREMEWYFAAADCLVLPYRSIFQSGVLFLSYSFGLPVIATDVGSFREFVIEGKTGFVVPPSREGLAAGIRQYFASNLYGQLPVKRDVIRRWSRRKFDWRKIGSATRDVYQRVSTS
jgi:D-inositol-3-phosphate glycosyltransferase